MHPKGGNTRKQWTLFGNAAIVAFLLAQVLDGALTYVGVQAFGHRVEANPLLAWLMQAVGPGTALASAKAVAAGFGAFLHLVEVHVIVAALTAVYLAAAVVPWTALLFFH
jgi:uncharacterized membrane protein